MNSKESKILSKVNKDSSISLLQKLIREKTTNPPGNEIKLGKKVANLLKDWGLETDFFPFGDGRANVISRIRGFGDKPSLIFSAHFDTVPVGEKPWSVDPFSGTIKDNKIYGRGAADMKGGMAAMCESARILTQSEADFKGDLVLAFTSGETSDLIGARKLIENNRLRNVGAILVGEPTGLNVFISEKGALWLKATAYGKTAHGSMPDKGENAILKMVKFLSKVDEFEFGVESHPRLGDPTLSIGTIQGGAVINVVPDKCSSQLDIRYLPSQEPSDLIAAFEELGEDEIEISMVGDPKLPVKSDPDSDIVKISVDAVKNVVGKKPKLGGASYFTDATILSNQLGVPAVIIGPADTWMTHQPDEYVEISNYLNAIKIYTLIAMRYCINSS